MHMLFNYFGTIGLTNKNQNVVNNLRDLNEKHIIAKVRQIEALSDVETLKQRSSEHRKQLERKDSEVKEAQAAAAEASEKARQLMREARKVIGISKSQPDLEELLRTIVNHNTEKLDADIDSEKARLELTQGGSNNVIKEFEERERQIDKLQHKLAGFQEQLAEYDYAINEIRGKWEPKLEALVKSISDAFSDSFARIGCAGQVALDRAEEGSDGQGGTDATSGSSSSSSDFDQWSIQIHVKFRENESLSQLDSHRQSGGERAVSTIFYLMALQSLSASPFRVVDEINQGMDPRNERMVHERLVDIACAHSTTATTNDSDNQVGESGGGQYFLITPKLLTGLVYKPGMRILCIVSGEHMPQDYSRLDFGQTVRRLREVKSRSKGKGRAIPTPPAFAATVAARS